MKYYISTLTLLFYGIVVQCTAQFNPYNYHSQKKLTCRNGAVVSAHPLASKVGIQILQQGGNAIDAAIATQLVLAVVYPGAGNIGGGGFMVAHLKNGQNITIDYREKASGAATEKMYLDSNGNAQIKLSLDGHLAAGVPGTVAGLFASLPYAKLSFAKLIQPAIDLAENGFCLSAAQADDFNEYRADFIRLNKTPNAFVKNNFWIAGDTLIQKELAATLQRIKELGTKGFYEGKTAELIVAEMNRGKGIISIEDLKNYTAIKRNALEFDYKKHHIVTMPLPSSGGIILLQLMKMIEDKNIALSGFQTAKSVQLITEAERLAYADRAAYLGDIDFVKVPLKKLTNTNYLRERIKNFTPGVAGNSKVVKAGDIRESEETTHLSILDNEGNAVSVTTTLNGHFGSRTVVAGAGFILNNEMDDFSVKPGSPNMYGAIGNKKNAIAPNKRMLSSMTPTIVLKNNKPYIIVGTPGGTSIPTSVFQTLMNILEYKLKPEDAVNKPKFHHQWLPDQIFVEKNFSTNLRKKLMSMGYTIVERPSIGRTELIIKEKGSITAVADSRGEDGSEGY